MGTEVAAENTRGWRAASLTFQFLLSPGTRSVLPSFPLTSSSPGSPHLYMAQVED